MCDSEDSPALRKPRMGLMSQDVSVVVFPKISPVGVIVRVLQSGQAKVIKVTIAGTKARGQKVALGVTLGAKGVDLIHGELTYSDDS